MILQFPLCRHLIPGVGALLVAGGATVGLSWPLQAQIIPDATLGAPGAGQSTVSGSSPRQISGGVIQGSSLFHSFSEFNVGNLEQVYFANPSGIQAIVTRVTGGNASNILGTLGVNGSASLFLINPNGIIFGPNARLDIAGSFVAITADQLRFPDGSEYSATNPQAPPLLTINLTPGLQLGSTPSRGAITLATTGQLVTGQDLVLVGETLQLQGQLRAGGDLTLRATNLLQLQNANLNVTSASPTLGTIAVTSQGPVLIDNTRIRTTTTPTNAQGGGTILISGSDLSLTNRSSIGTETQGAGRGGDIRLEAPQGTITIADTSSLSALTTSTGAGGSIAISGNQVQTQGRVSIRVVTQGTGQGGDLMIMAPQSVRVGQSLLAVETQRAGPSGALRISTDTLTIDGTKISTTVVPGTVGTGGEIFIAANTINILNPFVNFPAVDRASGIFAGTLATGPAGGITLQPLPGHPNLTVNFLDNNAFISAAGGTGAGGSVTILAPESITLQGKQGISVSTRGAAPAGQLFLQSGTINLRGIFLEAVTSGAGAGGDILIQANTLTMTDGAKLTTNTSGRGTAGSIELRLSDRLTLSGSGTGLFAGTTPGSTGNSGNIRVDPALILIQDRAGIAVSSQGQGLGGNITLRSGTLILDQNAFISAETVNSDGGNITLQVSDVLLLRRNSLISATAGGSGNGGNVIISAGFVVANPFENSDITANAVAGNGGTLRITTQAIFGLEFRDRLTPFSDITASSQFGVDGQVILNTPNTDPQRGLIPLPIELVDVTRKIVQGCAPNSDQQTSQFLMSGRGGLPPTPADPLSQPLFWQDWQLYGLTEDAPTAPPPKAPSSRSEVAVPHSACSGHLPGSTP